MNRNRLFNLFGCAVLCLAGASALYAQQAPAKPAAPRPFSVRRTTALNVGTRNEPKNVVIDYGSPSARGRKVFGELVPMDKVWRLGANEATRLITPVALIIGGKEIPAGTYSLWAVPGKDSWTLMVNSKSDMWGTPYKPEYDQTIVAKIDMKVESISSPVERFTVTIDKINNENVLIFEWETTRAHVVIADKK